MYVISLTMVRHIDLDKSGKYEEHGEETDPSSSQTEILMQLPISFRQAHISHMTCRIVYQSEIGQLVNCLTVAGVRAYGPVLATIDAKWRR